MSKIYNTSPDSYLKHKEVARKLRGVRIYQYDSETGEYIGKYESATEVEDDHGISSHKIAKLTRENPQGIEIDGLFFSRIAPEGVDTI